MKCSQAELQRRRKLFLHTVGNVVLLVMMVIYTFFFAAIFAQHNDLIAAEPMVRLSEAGK